jgi:hypothetical protein
MQASQLSKPCSKTRLALFWMHLANEPFLALFTLLGFILKKDLGASIFQISLLATLNPALALISFYAGAYLSQKHHRLVPNLMLSWFLGRVLFLVLPFYSSASFVLAAACLYQLFQRATTPCTIEILRNNLDTSQGSHIFSWVYFVSFLESLVLGLFIGKILDLHSNNWKYLLALSALFSMTSLLFQRKIPNGSKSYLKTNSPSALSFIKPFKDSWDLIQKSASFAKFQAGFMCGGLGLMIMNPALIVFYSDHLRLSHEAMTTARYVWMGAGVLASTFIWKIYLTQKHLARLTSLIILGFALFPLGVLYAKWHVHILYLSFFIYGIAQAGSHLVWHLSGMIFAHPQESSAMYTATNLLAVGLRGLIGPLLGGILTQALGPKATLMIGSIVCISGTYFMLSKKQLIKKPIPHEKHFHTPE